MQEEQVRQALRGLAEADGGLEAPLRVEAALLGAFRAQKRRGAGPRVAAWLSIAAAAAALVVAYSVRTPEIVALNYRLPVPTAPEIAPMPVARTTQTTVRRAAVPREVMTEFFSVAEGAPPFESGALLRVRVPASTMSRVGLPVREDRWQETVSADVLVGQEGIVRAIRFVTFEQ